MSDGSISKIQLPSGNIYDIKDENVGISSTYDGSTDTVTLVVSSLSDGDATEY